MEIPSCSPPVAYTTTNGEYGVRWQNGDMFSTSFTQSTPYKALTNRRRVRPNELPKDLHAAAIVHNPEDPCGIMTLSNVSSSKRGNFTNTRRDLHSCSQGIWSNGMFNTSGASIDRGVSTFSNLQGAWGRIGPSTYDATHHNGDWVDRWGTRSFQPSSLRSLYDHRHVDPRDGWVPIESEPQNMPY